MMKCTTTAMQLTMAGRRLRKQITHLFYSRQIRLQIFCHRFVSSCYTLICIVVFKFLTPFGKRKPRFSKTGKKIELKVDLIINLKQLNIVKLYIGSILNVNKHLTYLSLRCITRNQDKTEMVTNITQI